MSSTVDGKAIHCGHSSNSVASRFALYAAATHAAELHSPALNQVQSKREFGAGQDRTPERYDATQPSHTHKQQSNRASKRSQEVAKSLLAEWDEIAAASEGQPKHSALDVYVCVCSWHLGLVADKLRLPNVTCGTVRPCNLGPPSPYSVPSQMW